MILFMLSGCDFDSGLQTDYYGRASQNHTERREREYVHDRKPHPNTDMESLIIQGNVSAVKNLLERDPSLINKQFGSKGHSILQRAVESSKIGDYDLIDYLLLHPDLKINAKDYYDSTALHSAASKGDPILVEKLIARGAESSKNKYGYGPLDERVERLKKGEDKNIAVYDRDQIVLQLCRIGALTHRDSDPYKCKMVKIFSQAAFESAVQKRNWAYVKDDLERDPSLINQKFGGDQSTLLHNVVKECAAFSLNKEAHWRFLRYVLDSPGLDTNIKDRNGLTALDKAILLTVACEKHDIFQVLCSSKVKPTASKYAEQYSCDEGWKLEKCKSIWTTPSLEENNCIAFLESFRPIESKRKAIKKIELKYHPDRCKDVDCVPKKEFGRQCVDNFWDSLEKHFVPGLPI